MAPNDKTNGSESNGLKKATLKFDTIQVNDKIYSAQSLATIHPGGQFFVKAFAGQDATEAFLSYHRRAFPHEKVTNSLLGVAEPRKLEADADYLELCALVEKVLPRHKSFGTWFYWLKLSVILGSCIGLEYYIHSTKSYVWYLTALQGWLMALVGLNVQHDANHGAISRLPIVNRVLGYSQNWIGGSMLSWIHQHDVQHHVNTNDVHNDPDICGNPLLRFNPLKPLLKVHLFQYVYVFVIIALFGFSVVFESFGDAVKGTHFTPMSRLLNSHRYFEMFTSLVYFCRWFVLPYYQVPSWVTLVNIAPMFAVGGYYLAFFFVISHNFKGVHMFDKNRKDHNTSFLYNQVATSSNVGGRVLCLFNGGLNYQIEHHLFPRMQHMHYPTVAPIVREFCLSKGIPYVHFPTIADNMLACSQHMFEMGHKQDPSAYFKKE